MYWTMRFSIANQQDDYVKCLQAIEAILSGQINDISEREFLRTVEYYYSEKKLSIETVMEKMDKSSYDRPSQINHEDEFQYVFCVDCSNENDIVNIIYFCLANEELNGKAILCIKTIQPKVLANIKDLLSVILHTGIIKSYYVLKDHNYRKVSKGTNRAIRRFSPIYTIDEDSESVAYWRQSVHTFLIKIYKKVRVGSEYVYRKNYFLPHICPRLLRNRHLDDMNVDKFDHDVWLMNIFSECFCTGEDRELTHIEFVEKRYELWKSKELFERVKDMSLLAMYIFCLSDYFLKNSEADFMMQIEQEIFDARDMAEGLLQILENIYHSEKRRGYFCFRIHNNSSGRSKEYLEGNYPGYMNKGKEAEQAENYLEMKVADYSHCAIPNQFFKNFKKRKEHASEDNKYIYKKIENRANKLTVKSFFGSSQYTGPRQFWQDYNSISENVVHHYGIQVFESLVLCYEGYFRVRSQEKYQIDWSEEFYSSINTKRDVLSELGIPGTQYDILLPFRKQPVMQNISLNVNIDYTNNLLENFSIPKLKKTIDFTTDYCMNVFREVQKDGIMSFQEKKEKTIQELTIRLKKSLKQKEDNEIIHFSAENIALTMVELFCKTIILYITQRPQGHKCYIMITECTQSHFVEITRIMALFYDKQGCNPFMKGIQIFMSGQKEGEEFLITGTNLGEAIGSTEKLAFARCIHPNCLKTLKRMLKKHKMGITPNGVVSIAPFDMLEYNKGEMTLFERSLQNTLKQDVQSEKFGCKIDGLHVRIGSKIHVRTFYEAELMFHNNYYTSRFAYWLFLELNKEIDKKKPLILVGYENYSEMLLSELCNMLACSDIKTEYLIYEQKAIGKFRGRVDFVQCKDYQFVIIVPINSTMTTHIKVSGFLERTIRDALEKKGDKRYKDYHLDTVLNYGIILISDKKGNEKNNYWEKSTEEKNVIISKIDQEKMKFYTEVISEWKHPLRCKACFPEKDYTKEVPLVETSKASVVPMHAIGIRKRNADRSNLDVSEKELEKLKELSKFLVYDHVERNGNHFSYYFSTEKLWDFPDIRKNVQEWLEEKKDLFPAVECKVYDIIVAPLHFSNTAFVEEVNEYLFSNAALVLHFDVDKEFRMNVKTKYSSVQQLYDNLCQDDEKSFINFHFVDDTIISGHTYFRMKSLMSSLIKEKADSKVQIHIFKSIVLLLNRMSNSSVKNYIEDINYFMAYFNLNISSMRVNSDACVLCKKYDEWNILAEQASLNEVYKYWKNKRDNIKCKPVETIGQEKRDPLRQQRAEQYMIMSHKAKKLLDVLCDIASREEIKQEIVDKLFPENVDRDFEELVAVLKVLGRPFMTFRKEEKEAVFELMLKMLDTLLQESEPSSTEKIDDILRHLWYNVENRIKIITILLNRLAELESNYIIRKQSMNQIMEFCMDIKDESIHSDFAKNYLNRIKQLVGQSNDFAKGLFLEYLLLYDEEYQQEDISEKEIISLAGEDEYTAFKRNVYLENTKLADYGIEYLADRFTSGMEYTEENFKNVLNDNYYFDNFIQYLYFHKMVEIDDRDKIVKFTSPPEVRKLEGMVRFQLLYQKIFNEWKFSRAELDDEPENEEKLKNKFSEMLEYLKAASRAMDGEIIVPYKDQNESDKYIAMGFGKSTDIRRMENREQQLQEFMKENKHFEKDTYAICTREKGQKWILLKFYDELDAGHGGTSIIYLLFSFEIKDEGMILHSLKNLLIFRSKIWKILNLSGSTLLQNWTDNLFYKQQMLKSRAVGHSEMESLISQFQELVKLICSKEYEKKNKADKGFYRKYFELLINSMIGFMNSQVLGGKGKDYMSSRNMQFEEFWNGEKKTIQAVSIIWDLKINIYGEDELMKRKIRKGADKEDKTPEPDVLRTLFLAIFQNAKRHGGNKGGDGNIVTVYLEGDCLCISNNVEEKEKEKIEKNSSTESYRVGEGISQAVIFDICQSWYRKVSYDQMFAIENSKNGREKWSYVVKLPIIERGKENDTL